MADTLVPVYSSNDGPRITMAELMNAPAVIPTKILDTTNGQFFIQEVLRPGPAVPSGTVTFHESEPMYMDADPMKRSEWGTITMGVENVGVPVVLHTQEMARAFRVSDEEIRRGKTDVVQRRMKKIGNNFASAYESIFLAAFLTNGSIPQMLASGSWLNTTASSAGTGIFYDFEHAQFNISNADADSDDGTGVQKFQWEADTIVLNTKVAKALTLNPDITKVLQVGNVADQQGVLTGKFNQTFGGLRVITSWKMPPDQAIFVQSGDVGFISDEVPFNVTGMYRVNERKLWRADASRSSVVGIDQPKAAVIVHGIDGSTYDTSGVRSGGITTGNYSAPWPPLS